MSARDLIPGEPAPWFVARTTGTDKYHFGTVAGRYIVMSFFGSARIATSAAVLQGLLEQRDRFDGTNICFFGVSVDPADEASERVRQTLPGVRFFWDFDRTISQLYGASKADASADSYHRFTVIIDERLRILAVIPYGPEPAVHVSAVLTFLGKLPVIPPEQPATIQAPILVVPRILELELCRMLIDYYDQLGGMESGFMREVNGKTVQVLDPGFKRRRDQEILDERLRDAAMYRVHDRLLPEIHKAFQFKVTRIERHIVACYDSASGGYFSPHRDNTTKGTAHRRFAVSLNLNTGAYEGGKLRFPEFGRQTYEAPAGGAVVFSCSLLHEATAVTSGRRYAYLPFLYDDEAAKIRDANLQFVETNDS